MSTLVYMSPLFATRLDSRGGWVRPKPVLDRSTGTLVYVPPIDGYWHGRPVVVQRDWADGHPLGNSALILRGARARVISQVNGQ